MLLNEEKLIIKGKQLSLKKLFGLDEKTLVPQVILDKLNLGAQELEILLNNDTIEIWNKEPQLSQSNL